MREPTYAVLEGVAVRFTDSQAWEFGEGKWWPMPLALAQGSARVITQAEFKRMFPYVTELESALTNVGVNTIPSSLTDRERQYVAVIRRKDADLREMLAGKVLSEDPQLLEWFKYLAGIRDALGNLSNSVSFVATLMAKEYLIQKFGVTGFDAAEKPQGAPGADIEVRTASGEVIHCEIKTTRPYQPGFGAAQKSAIQKDLQKLNARAAKHKLMMVTDGQSFAELCRPVWRERARDIEIVNLLTGESFRHHERLLID